MSHPSSAVSIHPYFKVHAGRLEQFRAALPTFVAKTKTEKKCLYYEFTANGDEFFCREAYEDADGALTHLANVGEMLKQLLTIADLTRLEVHGPATEIAKLKQPLADLKPTWFVTICGVER